MLRDLELSEIPMLAGFAPEEWRVALDSVMLDHFGRDYFVARVAVEQGRIVAVGQGIATGGTGWAGNIIVHPEARRRGLGSRITQDLMDLLRARGCGWLLLVATELGEPVYSRLGFRRSSEYVFLRMPRMPLTEAADVRRLKAGDADAVFQLDAYATGEARGALLAPHLAAGYFLPTLGAGPVVAANAPAGLALLGFKHALYPGNAVVPEGNLPALRFLLERGAEETARAPRMTLGGEPPWRPECVFARGAGYCG
ncbi:MAG: GNAT family N-acetyltransferase [Acidobacteria bacterium]|nr:GNAT family N-acetyltransferase [Acidobacteriota bacterium]